MGERSERQAFDRRHAAEIVEITVLTGTSVGGAGKAGRAVLWTPSAEIIASLDEHGVVSTANSRLSWLATDAQRGTWIHDLRAHTQYVVRVRREEPDVSGHLALVEVLERDVHVPALDERLARYLEPQVVSSALGDVVLDRSLGHFSGEIAWWDGPIEVYLDIDETSSEGAETCAVALARLTAYAADAAATDASWRAYAATSLLDLALDWQEDDDEDEGDLTREPITRESFAQRIRLGSLSISADGSATPYFSDGDLFWGHVILLDVEPEGEVTGAHIAG